jgi:hypothetical protein
MSRIQQELQAVGCVCNRIVNGVPVVELGDTQVAKLVLQLHIADDITWISTNLAKHAKDLKTLIKEEQWIAYCRIQCDEIRRRRQVAYAANDGPNAVFLEMVSDGDTFTNAKNAAHNRKGDIQKEIPWPGDYQ